MNSWRLLLCLLKAFCGNRWCWHTPCPWSWDGQGDSSAPASHLQEGTVVPIEQTSEGGAKRWPASLGSQESRHQDLQPGPSSSRDQRSVWALTPHPMVSGTQAPCLQNEVVEVRLGSTSRSVLWFHMLVEKDWIQKLESPRKLVSLSYTHTYTHALSLKLPEGPLGQDRG